MQLIQRALNKKETFLGPFHNLEKLKHWMKLVCQKFSLLLNC